MAVKTMLGLEEIKKVLPHDGRWLLVRKVSEINGNSIEAAAILTPDDCISHSRELSVTDPSGSTKVIEPGECAGHFPQKLIVPGHLVLGLLAQIGLSCLKGRGFFFKKMRGKFHAPVEPGQEISLKTSTEDPLNETAEINISGIASVGNNEVVQWDGIADRGNLFPGKLAVPDYLILEALAQAGALKFLLDHPELKGRGVLLASTEGEISSSPVLPGQEITLKVSMGPIKMGMVRFTGVALANGQIKICWKGMGRIAGF